VRQETGQRPGQIQKVKPLTQSDVAIQKMRRSQDLTLSARLDSEESNWNDLLQAGPMGRDAGSNKSDIGLSSDLHMYHAIEQ
jgi:hypothetical protein